MCSQTSKRFQFDQFLVNFRRFFANYPPFPPDIIFYAVCFTFAGQSTKRTATATAFKTTAPTLVTDKFDNKNLQRSVAIENGGIQR